MLNDIIEEYDIEGNFNNLLIRYVNYLERENKWSEANTSNPKHAKSNFASRLKRLHNEGDHDKPVYKKFVAYVDKNKYRAQRDAERIAKNLMGNKEKQLEGKCNDLQTQLAEALREIEQLKEMNIQLEQEKSDLISKYDEGYENLEEENEKLKEERHKVIQDAYQCHYDTWKAEQENIVITELKEEIKQLRRAYTKTLDRRNWDASERKKLQEEIKQLKEQIEGDDV